VPEEPQPSLEPQEPTQALVPVEDAETVTIGKLKIRATPEDVSRFLIDNDISLVLGNPVLRVVYYMETCRREGVDPWSKPFDIIVDKKGKTSFYRNAEWGAQRRKASGITCSVLEHGVLDGVYFIRLKGVAKDGREDEDIGTCAFTDPMGRPIAPADKAEAMKKAMTAAKLRMTKSLEGAGAGELGGGTGEGEDDFVPRPAVPRQITPPTRVKALSTGSTGQQGAPSHSGAPEAQTSPGSPPAASPDARKGILVEAEVVQKGAEGAKATQAPQSVAPKPQSAPPAPPSAPPPKPPAVPASAQQPAPPMPPTPAPKVTTVVGKRQVFIPGKS
jgi:hypothetical protein